MTDLRAAAEMALEALDEYCTTRTITKPISNYWALRDALAQHEPFKPDWDMIEPYHERIKELEIENEKLRQALAQGEQEPVAWMQADQAEVYVKEFKDEVRGYTIPLYTAPTSKPWVSLTVDEILDCYKDNLDRTMFVYIVQTIEAKLKEKNT